ncbi:PBP family phospholipid-binding protein [Paucimonas lemoignei]|uniref:PBP family phospholipid-binding protein n=1 Tax=Paucimonas lemoignei TaxID=29443 RepID=A0A4R3I4G3_PAULE|nr:YbhB/YbcL family Raf kinase inhibitor-like protein [Paucimonas lemoignei]TCS39635.1 PBP family phospholipid-binding protein [Paucimonas lemoignei]
MSLSLVSSAFRDGTDMPSRHTCDGQDISPALSWSGVPPNAKSLGLIVDDPDAPDPAAPQRTWVHWVLYNLPPQSGELAEAVTSHNLPKGTKLGTNDWHRNGYGGPCPPIGRHRYFFKLYALDIELPELPTPDKQHLEKAMEGHVIEQAHLIGLYQRS